MSDKEQLFEGIVVRSHGGHHYVLHEDAVIDCIVRGRLKKEWIDTDLVALGDHVRWSPVEADSGVIEKVLPRKSALSRSAPPPGVQRSDFDRVSVEQVIVANPDQIIVVFAVQNPPLSPLMLDRYLVACEAEYLPPLIVANKVDLLGAEDDRDPFATYRKIGYRVLYTSALTGEGVDALHEAVQGKLSVLVGPSGVGKSSLLNALWPELDLRVGEISERHDRGRHTTSVARLLVPEPETYVADTPGMRQFRFWDIDPEQLEAFFPEMRPYLRECRFQPCTHMHEPDCAVRAAVERGEIEALRYESYRKMFEYEF